MSHQYGSVRNVPAGAMNSVALIAVEGGRGRRVTEVEIESKKTWILFFPY